MSYTLPLQRIVYIYHLGKEDLLVLEYSTLNQL
jgi:hypothetical protein